MTQNITHSPTVDCGLKAIEDNADIAFFPGIDTFEGRIDPHHKDESSQAYFVEMPGDLYWLKAETPTGYEMPFSEPAFIQIIKGDRDRQDEEGFLEYLQELKLRLERAHEAGTPFRLSELSADHPARVFASGLGAESA